MLLFDRVGVGRQIRKQVRVTKRIVQGEPDQSPPRDYKIPSVMAIATLVDLDANAGMSSPDQFVPLDSILLHLLDSHR